MCHFCPSEGLSGYVSKAGEDFEIEIKECLTWNSGEITEKVKGIACEAAEAKYRRRSRVSGGESAIKRYQFLSLRKQPKSLKKRQFSSQ